MATLNQDEQARVDRYNELQRDFDGGNKYVNAAQLEQARYLAERAEANAEARERWQAKLAADRKAEEDKRTARHDAQVKAAQDAYKRVAKATFPGSSAEFDAAWPDILRAWQIRATAVDEEALIARKREQMGGWL